MARTVSPYVRTAGPRPALERDTDLAAVRKIAQAADAGGVRPLDARRPSRPIWVSAELSADRLSIYAELLPQPSGRDHAVRVPRAPTPRGAAGIRPRRQGVRLGAAASVTLAVRSAPGSPTTSKRRVPNPTPRRTRCPPRWPGSSGSGWKLATRAEWRPIPTTGALDAASVLARPGAIVRTPASLRLLQLDFALADTLAADRGQVPPTPVAASTAYAVARTGYRVATHVLAPWQYALLSGCGTAGAPIHAASGGDADSWARLIAWLPVAVDAGMATVTD